MSSRLERTATVVIVVCIAALTATELSGLWPRTPPPTGRELVPEQVENWSAFSEVGHGRGAANPTVTIVEFADFQCPACKAWNTRILSSLLQRYPDDVRLVFRHWPLEYHPLAYAAARASECAASQGLFDVYHDSLYARQHLLTPESFVSIAELIAVPKLDEFRRCSMNADPVAVIERDAELIRSVGGPGTPTFVINGTLHRTTPDSAQLDSIVSALLMQSVPKRVP